MARLVEGVDPIQLPVADDAPPVIKPAPPPYVSGKFDRAEPKKFSISELVGRSPDVGGDDAPPEQE